jgi:hypothetical protein
MYIKCSLRENTSTGLKEWIITDDDFEVKSDSHTVWDTIVIEYKKRNLNVAKNLARAIINWSNPNITTADLYNHIIHNIPSVEPYKDELQKYMMLL